MGNPVEVAKTDDLEPGECMLVEIGDKKIALINLEGRFYAIDDTCTHKEASLSKGDIEGDTISCPWHAAKFSIKTGEALSKPATVPLKSYRVEIKGDAVILEI